MQLALPGCPNTTQQPVHGMALQSSWKWPNRYCVQGRGPGNQSKRCRSSWTSAYSTVDCTKASKCLGAETKLGARLRNELKTRRVTCGLISYMKMLLCFNSLFPKTMLSYVPGCPLNSAGDLEESLAVPARTLESPLKTSEWLVAANIQTIPWILTELQQPALERTVPNRHRDPLMWRKGTRLFCEKSSR